MSYNSSNNCACQIPANVVQVNKDMSQYTVSNVPTREIKQNIFWLRSIKEDCNHKIDELNRLLRERQRSKKWRSRLNEIASQFCQDEYLHLTPEQRKQLLMQRFSQESPHKLQKIQELIEKWANKRRRELRNKKIYLYKDMGFKPSEIAGKCKISRQQVHNILKARNDKHILI